MGHAFPIGWCIMKKLKCASCTENTRMIVDLDSPRNFSTTTCPIISCPIDFDNPIIINMWIILAAAVVAVRVHLNSPESIRLAYVFVNLAITKPPQTRQSGSQEVWSSSLAELGRPKSVHSLPLAGREQFEMEKWKTQFIWFFKK